MKLNRKVASVLLAVTMFAGVLSVPAMADDESGNGETGQTPATGVVQIEANNIVNNTTTKTATVKFPKILDVSAADGASVPGVTFSFDVTVKEGQNGVAGAIKDNNGADVSGVASATIDAGATPDASKQVSADVELAFDLSKFSAPNVYTYTLEELACGNDDIKIDDDDYTMRVCVENVLNENDQPTGDYKIAWVTLEGTKGKVNKITNAYSTYDLTLKKIVTGNMGDKNQEFKFTIAFASDASNSGKTFTVDGTQKEFGTDGAASVEVTLSHNEEVTIKGLPSNVTYTITESENAGYDVAYNGATQDTSNENKATGAIKVTETNDENVETETAADRSVTVTNNKDAATATGLLMDVAPYAAMILLAAAAAFVFLRRRNSNED